MDLLEIQKRKTDINQEINKLYSEQRELELTEITLKEQLLLSNNTILQEDMWTLKSDKNFNLYIQDDNRNGFKMLRKIFETDNHTFHVIFEKYSLYFNDGEMHLQADSNEDLLTFIKTFNLKVKSTLHNRLNEIDKSIKELQVSKGIIEDLMSKIN